MVGSPSVRTVLLLGLLVVLLAGTVVGLIWALQRKLIYLPDDSPVRSASAVIAGARDITLRTDDGLDLGAWFVPARGRPQGSATSMAVLVAPGNGGTARAGRGSPRSCAGAGWRSC